MKKSYRTILEEQPLLFDGAMGSMIHAAGFKSVCNEELCVSHPDVISDIQRAYLDAGADIITTNTFGASRMLLSEYGLGDEVENINRAAVNIARKLVKLFSTEEKPRFVAGELGSSTKLPTLGQISFEQLFGSFAEQVKILIESGVDMITVATCQDPLLAKAAAAAVRYAARKLNRDIPLFVSVTVEKTGSMLLGTDLIAALASVAQYKPQAFGINCSVGPDAMEEFLNTLHNESPFPISCRPNAGMPENRDGHAFYSLSPEEFAAILGKYTREFHLSFVGGCCGTTPEHIRSLSKEIRGAKPDTKIRKFSKVSSLYAATSLDQEPKPFIIAEQTNVNGSKKFRDFLLKSDFDAMTEVGKASSKSSHALDICIAYTGRDECLDMTDFVKKLSVNVDSVLMIDSTNPEVLASSLALSPGRPIINSINLEDGGEKAKNILSIGQKFGAAIVALTIDEKGMAKTIKAKIEVAKRLIDLCLSEGFSENDILIDALTFTLGSGDPELKTAALETLGAIKKIKREFSGVRTVLGVSNISFGLPGAARKILNSVFLSRAIEEGLDAAIINPIKILPVSDISKEDIELCNRLIDNDSSCGDPLSVVINRFQNIELAEKKELSQEKQSDSEILTSKIIHGNVVDLENIISRVLENTRAKDIINNILLPAMQEVGKRFGDGKMPLPFVLQSAEVMRKAVDFLSPHVQSNDLVQKSTLVLATVRGDVHDIGKNLVSTILSNNGFKVVDIGIRQPAAAILEAVRREKANAIGLSGLLVSSTEVMLEDLKFFREHKLSIPVLCGGAALTKSYVDNFLSKAYGAPVYYCADAFSGLKAMENIKKL